MQLRTQHNPEDEFILAALQRGGAVRPVDRGAGGGGGGGGGGGDPYDLSGYTIPFAVNWPTAPTITSEATVTPATLAANNVSGRRLTLQAGSYGAVTPNDDQEWVLEAGAEIDAFTYTGAQRVKVRGSTPRVGRIGALIGPSDSDLTTTTDILFDGIYQTNGTWNSASQASNGLGGQRVAVVNSSLNTASYTIYVAATQAGQFHDLIVAGNYVRNDNSIPITGTVAAQHAVRLMTMNNFIFVGNYIEKFDSGLIWRVHCNSTAPATDSYNGFVADNVLVDSSGGAVFSGFQIYPASSAYTPGNLYDVIFDGNEIHIPGGGAFAFDTDAPPAGWSTHIYDMQVTNNFSNGTDGLWNVPDTFPSFTVSGNTSQAYNAGSVPTPAAVLGWAP